MNTNKPKDSSKIDTDNEEQLMDENTLPQEEDTDTNDKHNLAYNDSTNSYEIDVESDDEEYDHPQVYDTSAPSGEDMDSTYDEANPYVGDEYDDQEELVEKDLENLGMHTDHGQSVRVSREDEILSETPEDLRPDLDEEGYPKNDEEL